MCFSLPKHKHSLLLPMLTQLWKWKKIKIDTTPNAEDVLTANDIVIEPTSEEVEKQTMPDHMNILPINMLYYKTIPILMHEVQKILSLQTSQNCFVKNICANSIYTRRNQCFPLFFPFLFEYSDQINHSIHPCRAIHSLCYMACLIEWNRKNRGCVE